MARLLYPHEREAISAQIRDAINDYCKATYDDGHRNHLGASMIGDVCLRRLWYGFRWVQQSQFDGRMQRLFNRGHLEELRWIEWLRGVGFHIWYETEDGKQFRIGGVEGHYGGSLDSVGKAPDGTAPASKFVPTPAFIQAMQLLSEVGPFLVEYKTYNDKQFNKLTADKVVKTKPRHWVQMCVYGAKNSFRYAVYCAINKNDDDLHVEIVELDYEVARMAEIKAESVITSQQPPPRFSELPSHVECSGYKGKNTSPDEALYKCDFFEICHRGKAYEKNCRSCQFATPVKNAQWFCGKYNAVIPPEVIKVGCDQWHPIGRIHGR